MDHALNFTWPQCLPADLDTIVTPFRAAWMQLVMECPLVRHTFIFATTKQMLCLRGHAEDDDMSYPAVRALSVHQSEALNCARTAIEALPHGRDGGPPPVPFPPPLSSPSDALILAVTILAVNGARPHHIPPQPHPLSPLAKTQSLHLFSLLGVVEVHARAAAQLVEMKGGLGAVDTYGVRDTLLLSDVYFSSILGTRPVHVWPTPVTSLVDSGRHILDARATRLLSQLGTGFDAFKLDEGLRGVLRLMCDLVVALDHLVRRADRPPKMSDIVPQRNAVQNKLLWLEPCCSSCPRDHKHHLGKVPAASIDRLANITRIAATIFSDMVLFPLSPATGIKPRLAGELRRCLRTPSAFLDIEAYGPPSAFTLWVLTLGGIAASFTRHRGWYVEKVAEYYGRELLLRCDDDDCRGGGGDDSILLRNVNTFLWWAEVCEQPARLLWAQARAVYLEEKILAGGITLAVDGGQPRCQHSAEHTCTQVDRGGGMIWS